LQAQALFLSVLTEFYKFLQNYSCPLKTNHSDE
jgi:hypothetical protein